MKTKLLLVVLLVGLVAAGSAYVVKVRVQNATAKEIVLGVDDVSTLAAYEELKRRAESGIAEVVKKNNVPSNFRARRNANGHVISFSAATAAELTEEAAAQKGR